MQNHGPEGKPTRERTEVWWYDVAIMKPILFAALLLAAQASVPPQPQTPKRAGGSPAEIQKSANADEDKTAPTLAPGTESAASEKRDGNRTASENKQDHVIVDAVPRKDRWDKAYIFATLLLVLIGGLTFAAVWYQAIQTKLAAQAARDSVQAIRDQAHIMERQTAATETAANAAREGATATTQSVSALIDSERAWLIVEILPVCRIFGDQWHRPAGNGWASLGTDEICRGYHLRHTMKLTNMGRTPAQILRFRVDYSHLPEGATDLPGGSIGDLVETREFHHALGAAQSIEIQEPIIDVFNNQGSTVEQIRAVHELRATLVVHGWVEYQHVFDKTNTQRVDFCYVYSPETHRLNKVTRPKQQRAGQNSVLI